MENPILSNTTLASIVRDEEDNPAHGIEAWLRATLPYVERAVVVDTGSTDRTRDILDELKKDYPHLEVFYRQFDDFASSRNFSLEKVRTKRVLILDADELLIPEEYERLGEYLTQTPARSYGFTFKEIYPDGTVLNNALDLQLVRLFDIKGAVFKNSKLDGFYEDVQFPNQTENRFVLVPMEIAIIKHFLPSKKANERKKSFWYGKKEFKRTSPLDHAKIHAWKKRNGGRNFYLDSESNLIKYFPELVGDGCSM